MTTFYTGWRLLPLMERGAVVVAIGKKIDLYNCRIKVVSWLETILVPISFLMPVWFLALVNSCCTVRVG